MKNILRELKISLLTITVFALLLCGIYPFAVWAASSLLFSDKAKGSLIEREGIVIGSELIGQEFHSPRYFHSRPSAAGKGYDASSSSGSNLGPTSKKFIDGVKLRAEAYRTKNGLSADSLIPPDAVTASASGLDPHISPRNAELQSQRIANERNISLSVITKLIQDHTDSPLLGFIGDSGVNVVKLNLALDKISSH